MRGKVFIKREEIVSRKIAGETLLVPVMGSLADMQRIFSLNAVGEYIWCHLTGDKDLEEIVSGVVSDFEVTREEAARDVQEFIDELLRSDLVKEVI